MARQELEILKEEEKKAQEIADQAKEQLIKAQVTVNLAKNFL